MCPHHRSTLHTWRTIHRHESAKSFRRRVRETTTACPACRKETR